MSNWDELKRQEENLRKAQEKERIEKEEGKRLDDENLKRKQFSSDKLNTKSDPKLSPKETKASPHAPIFPCVKCRRSHRKGQCKGP